MTLAEDAWRVNARLRAALRSATKPACAGSSERLSGFRVREAAQAAFAVEQSETRRRSFSCQPSQRGMLP